MSDNKDELSRILDDALASYSRAEPLAGLEQRILNRVQTKQVRRNRVSFLRVALVSSFAVLLITAGWAVRVEQHGTAPRVITAAAHREVQSVTSPVVFETPVRFKPRRGIVAARALPKQQQFPMPTPLSAEERALVAFVTKHPKEAAEAFASLNRADEPLEIQEIVIKPLEVDSLQEEER